MAKYEQELRTNAAALVSPGRGILAADESTGTIGKRFAPINVENVEENRRKYRQLLFKTEDLGKNISGVIMYDETLYQKSDEGVLFPEFLKSKGVLTGIKVDKGVVIIPGTVDEESATQGLDDLGKRCAKYYEAGARFAKWRAVLKIGVNSPSELAIHENAWGLARYASICQENGLVPIVEPEILMDGTHSIETAAAVTEKVGAAVVKALADQHILFEGMLLKPNMVLAGMDLGEKFDHEKVAFMTVQTLSRFLPAAVPGVVFLSGGQSEEDATLNLNAMNKVTSVKKPWALSFSYGRALQHSVLRAWMGEDANIPAAQKVLLERAAANGAATLGEYAGGSGASESLYVKNYSY